MLIFHEHQMQKWYSRIQTDCRLLTMYRFNTNKHNKTFVYLHMVLDCFSEGQDIVEGHFGRTTVFDEYRPCDARVCFTHFPWGTLGCQLSFHCVPLQYLMVHFFRLKRNILERKKPWPLAKRRSARLSILKDIILSTSNIHFDRKEINKLQWLKTRFSICTAVLEPKRYDSVTDFMLIRS